MATFGSILDKPSISIDKPKPLPTGTYVCIVKGLPRQDKSKQKGTEFVEFNLEIVQPLQDVSEEAIEAAGGVVGKTIRGIFYLTDDSLWRLKKFLVEDLELEELDKSLRVLLSETPGKQVVASVKHEPSQDGKSVFSRLDSTAPVSALAEADED